MAVHQYFFRDMHSLDSHLEHLGPATHLVVVLGEILHVFDDSLEPGHSLTRGAATLCDLTGVNPEISNFRFSYLYPRATLAAGTGSVPVVSARRLTSTTIRSDGKFSTHWPVRIMFWGVFETVARPRMQRHPSQKADDIGARLYDPSSFTVLIRTTGVPRYKIGGSLTMCMDIFSLRRRVQDRP
jgi:hypothetical protein